MFLTRPLSQFFLSSSNSPAFRLFLLLPVHRLTCNSIKPTQQTHITGANPFQFLPLICESMVRTPLGACSLRALCSEISHRGHLCKIRAYNAISQSYLEKETWKPALCPRKSSYANAIILIHYIFCQCHFTREVCLH